MSSNLNIKLSVCLLIPNNKCPCSQKKSIFQLSGVDLRVKSTLLRGPSQAGGEAVHVAKVNSGYQA